MLNRKDAIILKNYDFGNSSKIIHILTQDSERLSLIAKGAKRTKSQFAGNIEPLNLTQIVYYLKPGKDLGILKEANIKESYENLRKDLYSLNIAWGLIWIGRTIPSPMSGLFGLEKRALTFLNKGFKEEVIGYFLLSLFKLQGVSPQMDKCAKCGISEIEFFDIEEGKGVCKKCKKQSSIPFLHLKEKIQLLEKGRFKELQEWKETNKKELLKFLLKYGVYHLGEWLNRLSEILPFSITP
ncbi:MAG: DNA repair protein RecO [candidate division WOR-3 bacterium]